MKSCPIPTMTGRGLIARFLYASPPSRIGSRVFRTQPIPPEITAVYRSLIFRRWLCRLLEMPRRYTFPEKAFDLMADYFQEHEKFLVGEGQAISDWASKYIGAVLRIAGLLHCADMEDDKTEVGSFYDEQGDSDRKIFSGSFHLRLFHDGH